VRQQRLAGRFLALCYNGFRFKVKLPGKRQLQGRQYLPAGVSRARKPCREPASNGAPALHQPWNLAKMVGVRFDRSPAGKDGNTAEGK